MSKKQNGYWCIFFEGWCEAQYQFSDRYIIVNLAGLLIPSCLPGDSTILTGGLRLLIAASSTCCVLFIDGIASQ